MEPMYFKVPRQKEETVRVENWDLPYFYEPIHFHEECQLTYIIESTGMILVGDKLDRFKKGEIYLIGKNLPHVFRNSERYFEEDSVYRARAISIFFSYDSITELLNYIPESFNIQKLLENSFYGIKLSREDAKLIAPYIKKMPHIEGFDRVLELLNILGMIAKKKELKLISSKTILIMDEEDNKRLNKVFEYIMQNFREHISLDDVAALVYMTPTSFCRYFKLRTQKTFSGFLTEVRIGNTCKLLSKSSCNVAQACYSSGYNNISNFHRHFLNVTGMTPNQYRKNVLKTSKVKLSPSYS
ncbi:MAG TPA: AraC family transcriptional regulator [Bacteroidales bacterium]|nr:AraC family transcriptional regulator [Bacteroidales bacterium]